MNRINCGKKGHFKGVCSRSLPKKDNTSKVGKMTIENKVEEVICRKIA